MSPRPRRLARRSATFAILAGLALTTGAWRLVSWATTDLPPIPEVAQSYGGCDDCTETARKVAWSMDHNPGEWTSDLSGYDMYSLRRGGRIAVWTGNQEYGIQLARTPMGLVEGDRQIRPSDHDKALIWASAKKIVDARTLPRPVRAPPRELVP